MGLTADALANHARREMPSDGPGHGTRLTDVWEILKGAPAYKQDVVEIERNFRSEINPREIHRQLDFHDELGICYKRKSRSGHCIVVTRTEVDDDHPHGLLYTCYQSSNGGKDMTADMERSHTRMAFWFSQRGFGFIGLVVY